MGIWVILIRKKKKKKKKRWYRVVKNNEPHTVVLIPMVVRNGPQIDSKKFVGFPYELFRQTQEQYKTVRYLL